MKEQTADRQAQIGNRNCQACGAQAQRRFAKYCLDCGKKLWEDYEPLDNLRSSYRLQNQKVKTQTLTENAALFEKPKNAALELAWASLVYSMFPYLGILFTPGAIFMSSIGAIKAYRRSQADNLKSALFNIILSLVIFSIQFLLWWLLYVIPDFGRNITTN